MVETMVSQSSFSEQQIWDWLSEVQDPEIPVVSVVDLGIVRGVKIDQHTVHVTITPTYSGCPATAVIAMDIETTLIERGVENLEIKQNLAPPWTTDWINEEGRKKLFQYGIAPPKQGVACSGALKVSENEPVSCPQCLSSDTECVSPFGSTPCKAAYRCRTCREPFDYFKPF